MFLKEKHGKWHMSRAVQIMKILINGGFGNIGKAVTEESLQT